MFYMIIPVVIIVAANTFYNISQKSTPSDINSFVALLATYVTAAGLSLIMFLATGKGASITQELRKLNWASFVLAFAVVGLELGYILLYRAGWKVSSGSVVCNIALAIVLIFVAMLLYKETITVKQIAGIAVCCLGLYLITM